MNSHFEPNKFKRVEEYKEKKDRVSNTPTKNQPKVKIWTITLFQPKPSDKMDHYFLETEKPVDAKKVAERLAELYGMNVYLYGNFLNFFDVYLENPVMFSVIESTTLQVLSEFDA